MAWDAEADDEEFQVRFGARGDGEEGRIDGVQG